MLLHFCIFFCFVTVSAAKFKDLNEYEINSSSNYKVGITNDGRFEPTFSPRSKKIKITKLQTCGSNLFPHGMYIDKQTKTPMLLCEINQCKALKEIECEKNVSTENCNGYFKWIAGFMPLQNGSSDVTKVECCRYKELTFSTFVRYVNLTITKDYVHQITVEAGNLKAFEYLTNVQKVETDDNSTAYFAAVFRMECLKMNSENGLPSYQTMAEPHLSSTKTAIDAKRDASLMKFHIALMEKRLTGNHSYSVVQPSLGLTHSQLLFAGFPDNTWPPELQKFRLYSGNTDKKMTMFWIIWQRLIATEMVAKSPFGYYYKEMTQPWNPDEILKRYNFENIKRKKYELKGNEVEIKTFKRNPVSFSEGVMEKDNGEYEVHERNVAENAQIDPSFNRLMVSYEKHTFANFYLSYLPPYSSITFRPVRVFLAGSCGEFLFPHGAYIDWDTNSLMMMCELHTCLNSYDSECSMNPMISSCNGSNEWVTGFRTKNKNDTTLEVECCRARIPLHTEFIKDVIIAKGQPYEHDVVVEGGKLIAKDYLNNFRMFKTEKGEIIYKASVYRLKCPSENWIPISTATKAWVHEKAVVNIKDLFN